MNLCPMRSKALVETYPSCGKRGHPGYVDVECIEVAWHPRCGEMDDEAATTLTAPSSAVEKHLVIRPFLSK